MELLKNWFGKKGIEYHEQQWDVKSIGKLVVPETLTHKNAFLLTNSVPELFFPVDFVADRVSKVRYYIADLSGICFRAHNIGIRNSDQADCRDI